VLLFSREDLIIEDTSGAGSGMVGMAAPYQSAEIWAVDFQENH